MLTISELARGIGYSRQYMQRCVKDGCPLDDFENARLWLQANRPNRKKEPKMPVGEIPLLEDAKNGDADMAELYKVVDNAAIAAENAWKLLEEAFIEGKPTKISGWLNLHSKAVEARVKAESMVRQEMERQGILIPLNDAKAKVRKVVEIIVSRLSAMPQNIAPRCNPHNPEHAMEILQEECAAILADAQKAALT